ncbi:hypothetical protein SELMODRAFT_430840 [Selaginella moellendorffii]|uniref:Uncharacterized protein n=1 Tax=Selaginella moellendorffii TaxID=88036 RepID=D8TAP3_SELML|nr:hypothetical protein SELMODRAFT_430840 [Selaginella moellendorffii]
MACNDGNAKVKVSILHNQIEKPIRTQLVHVITLLPRGNNRSFWVVISIGATAIAGYGMFKLGGALDLKGAAKNLEVKEALSAGGKSLGGSVGDGLACIGVGIALGLGAVAIALGYGLGKK